MGMHCTAAHSHTRCFLTVCLTAGSRTRAGAAVRRGPCRRRASVSEFKGKHYVNVREYYDKGGTLLPGAKGVALGTDPFAALAAAAPHLSAALAAAEAQGS